MLKLLRVSKNPKTLATVIVLAFALIGFSLVEYHNLSERNKKLEQTIGRMQETIEEYQAVGSLKFDQLSTNTKDLLAKVVDLEDKIAKKNETIQSLRSQLVALESEVTRGQTALEGKLESSKKELEKQDACNKANELSQIPSDMVFRATGCNVAYRYDRIPSSTQGALEYVRGFLDNYQKTGSPYWTHNPDVCVDDAQSHLPILEDRHENYLEYKEICDEN